MEHSTRQRSVSSRSLKRATHSAMMAVLDSVPLIVIAVGSWLCSKLMAPLIALAVRNVPLALLGGRRPADHVGCRVACAAIRHLKPARSVHRAWQSRETNARCALRERDTPLALEPVCGAVRSVLNVPMSPHAPAAHLDSCGRASVFHNVLPTYPSRMVLICACHAMLTV